MAAAPKFKSSTVFFLQWKLVNCLRGLDLWVEENLCVADILCGYGGEIGGSNFMEVPFRHQDLQIANIGTACG